MFTVFDCIAYEHDLKLIALAAVICMIASFAAIYLVQHVEKTRGAVRRVWLCGAGSASGFGIWATHFIAMLAFTPGIQSAYNVALTLLSLLAAIALTTFGFSIATSPTVQYRRWFAGAILGGGIAVMHYTGMAAFEIPGRIEWNPPLVVVSILLGSALGPLAMTFGLESCGWGRRVAGALLLTAGICGHHFTAMAAATLIPDSSVQIPPNTIPQVWLAIVVMVASIAVFIFTLTCLAIDVRARQQSKRQSERLNSLANAAFEGLMICEDSRIITANTSLATLLNCSVARLIGRDISEIIADKSALNYLNEKSCTAFETYLSPCDEAAPLEVEVFSRPIVSGRRLQTVIAVRDLRDRKKAESDIYYLAHHDGLTGLANRNFFNQQLAHLLSAHQTGGEHEGKHLAVLCLDLDRFKEVNDLFGHAAGDALLQKVARHGSDVLRKTQLMARLGGDEFAVLLPALSNRNQAQRIAESLLSTLQAANMQPPVSSAIISVSIGIAIYPDDASDSTTLLSHADTALYRAKASGRGCYQFFDTAMGEGVRDRRKIEYDLSLAISKNELSLAYQPLTRTDNREIFGFEALLRWHNPERGDVAPSVFIPFAEESGLILQIGEWVLREACREASRWTRPLVISVNVSATQLHSPNFVQLTRQVLAETGLQPSLLEMEITETALIRDPNRALITVCQLKGLGIKISMDDFGTGYSSLSNLRDFPFDKIKIDRSFIQSVNENAQAATIVRAVLGLARGLELPVIAEGVETEEELAFLRAEDCHEAQGFLLGKPQPIECFKSILMADLVQ